jgi:hypothetical protein
MIPLLRWLQIFLLLLGIVDAFIDEIPGVRREIEKIKSLKEEDLIELFQRRNELPTFEEIIEGISKMEQTDINHDDSQCIQDSSRIYAALTSGVKSNFTQTAFSFLDSSGKVGPGLLRGRRNFYGFSNQCLAIKYQFPDHLLEGWYFSVDFLSNFTNATGTDDKLCGKGSRLVYSWDLCLPKSCSASLIYQLLYCRFSCQEL